MALLNLSAAWLSISNSKVRRVHGYGTVVVTAARALSITDKKFLSYYLSNLGFYFEVVSTQRAWLWDRGCNGSARALSIIKKIPTYCLSNLDFYFEVESIQRAWLLERGCNGFSLRALRQTFSQNLFWKLFYKLSDNL